MKVVIAIDSFKGSLSSIEAGQAAKRGILAAKPDADITVLPLADGGEGTADALAGGLHGKRLFKEVTGPLFTPVRAAFGYIEESRTAVIEMAQAAGITLIPDKAKDPLRATTRGVGELIRYAAHLGCRSFIIGIGGSATNDGGIGMLKALGYEFYDSLGQDAGEGAQALSKIESISAAHFDPLLKQCHFKIACDVTNPLCGPDGATYIYGPQKGVTEALKAPIDEAMAHYADIAARFFNKDERLHPGAGAAGGLGFAFLTFLNGELAAGTELVMEAVGLEDALKTADIAVTGEGCLDGQTAMGKAPAGVARIAKKYGAKVIAFAGSIAPGAAACHSAGIDAYFPIVRGVTTLKQAMDTQTAAENLAGAAEQVFRLL